MAHPPTTARVSSNGARTMRWLAVTLPLAFIGCGPTRTEHGAGEGDSKMEEIQEVMTNGIDQGALRTELATSWLAGLEATEHARGTTAVAELVSDWAREANATTSRPEAVANILRDDARRALAQTPLARRVITLERMLLMRRADYLAGRTYALGVALVDGTITPDVGRVRGRELLADEALGARVKDVERTPETEPLHRTLGDAVMEALFAVEGKAMSARLARYQAAHSGRPDIR